MKKKLRIFIISICVLVCLAGKTIAEEIEAKPVNEKYVEWQQLSEEERSGTIQPVLRVKNIENNLNTRLFSPSLKANASYNLRDDFKNIKIKNQQSVPDCWAFATTTILESHMAIKGKNVEYSPRHMDYATSKTFLDGTNSKGFNRELIDGGNYQISSTYLVNGQGPVYETYMPFENNISKISLASINKTARAQVKEFVFFPTIYKEKNGGTITYSNGQTGSEKVIYTTEQVTALRNSMKEHIVKYGGIGSNTCHNATQYFSNPTNIANAEAYYCDNSDILEDHAITIIGWDDNYAINNFNENCRPTLPGAWIVQNSHGENVYKNGILYISYEDTMIERETFGIISMSEVDYDRIYQYDNYGVSMNITISSGTYTANVFDKTGNIEYLTEIGIYTSGMSSDTYEIYVNSQDGTLSKDKLTKIKTISNNTSDYVTVKLDSPIQLVGSKFALAVKYINSSGVVTIPLEAKLAGSIWEMASSNSGESFRSSDATNWIDFKSQGVSGTNDISACIKGFVKDSIDTSQIIFSEVYDIDSLEKVIKRISPNTTVKVLKENIQTTDTIKIYNSSDEELSGTIVTSTGMKLKTVNNANTYKIAVRGDVNGDGRITTTDLMKLKKDITDIEKLIDEFAIAGDVDFSGKITSTDIMQIKKVICELMTF